MCGSMMEACVAIIGAITAERGRQCFSENSHTFVTSSSSCDFDASGFAHYMYDIQGTIHLSTETQVDRTAFVWLSKLVLT